MRFPLRMVTIASVVASLAMAGARAQQRPDGRPLVPRAEQPSAIVPPPPTEPDDDPFAGPSGLSEEAKKSYREIPPQISKPAEAEAPAEEAPETPRSTPPAVKRPEYVVEPPDLILVEVLEALPGRPISGERLVRPDGRISLGFYGELPVAGLTITQIKERIVLHLRKYLNDETLGLLAIDDETNEPMRDAQGRPHVIDPKETDRVFVDVTAYNSSTYYVLGDVQYPGRIPYTGGENVLDVLQNAGGLMPTADRAHIRLIRSFPKGSPPKVLPIDYDEITMGTDMSTNYAMLPYDRLVVPGASTGQPVRAGEGRAKPLLQTARPRPERSAPALYFDRDFSDASTQKATEDLTKRIDEMERKLDQLIAATSKNRPKPGPAPEDRIAALEGKLNELTVMIRQSLDRQSGEPRPTLSTPRHVVPDAPRRGRPPLPMPPDGDPFDTSAPPESPPADDGA